ncbi:triple tyrosine motif-containing protein [Flavilitoribacter nigricans]|nr:triple tyrosine motif-containing protein [Flavilitoribacter nigricans]
MLLFSAKLVFAQEVPRVISYDKEEYKAYNQNWGITQTPEGLMYFANSAGLLEYDGQYWRTYPLPDKQILRSVASDGKGKIFSGGYGEFGYWEADENGSLQYYSLQEELEHPQSASEEIWNIVVDSQLVLFHSFSEVYAYDYEQVYRIDDPGLLLFVKKIRDHWIFPLIQDELRTWTPEQGFQILSTGASLSSLRVKGLVTKPEGGFWVGTERAGIFYFDEDNEFNSWPTEVDQELRDFQINRMELLRSGHLAIGTILNGLYVLDQRGRLIYHINKESGLQNNTVLGLWEDHNGNLWLALDKGIDLVMLSQALNFYPDVTGKLGTVYTALVYEGLLYVGTNHGLYVRRFDADEEFQLVEGTQLQVWDLFVKDGQLLCGHNNGTFQIEGRQARRISPISGGWHFEAFPGRDDLLLQSTYTGLVILGKDERGWAFRRRINGLQLPIKKFYFDESGYIWALHSTQGLWRVRLNETLDSINYTETIDESYGLPTTFGLDLVEIDEQLIIRADTSLFRWDPATEALQPLDRFNGVRLPRQRISLLPGNGREWFIATADRLLWYRDSSLLSEFSIKLVPNFEEIIAIDSANYLFCMDNGFALLDTTVVGARSRQLSEPIISRIEVLRPQQRQLVPFRSVYRNGERMLEFSPQERQIRFYFALPFHGEQIQYRYRILNYDDEWSEWSQLALIEIAKLRAGDYTFELQADQGTGITQQAFRVLPHWYETTFAKTVYFLLALLGAFLLWNWHQVRLRKQLQALEDKKEKQLQEERIKARNETLQQDVLRKSQELANSTFNLVRKNEILIQLKEALATGQRKESPKSNKQLIRLIDRHLTDEEDWKIFETNFNQVHEVFFKKLKSEYPDLTPGDLRLAAYLKMNLSSKEIAPLLNISLRGVENKRYRLRRKMELDTDTNLADFLMQY